MVIIAEGQGDKGIGRQGEIVLELFIYLSADHPVFRMHNHIDQFAKDVVVGRV